MIALYMVIIPYTISSTTSSFFAAHLPGQQISIGSTDRVAASTPGLLLNSTVHL